MQNSKIADSIKITLLLPPVSMTIHVKTRDLNKNLLSISKAQVQYGNYVIVVCTGKHGDGISVHTFLKASLLRRQGINFIFMCVELT